jgi:hypothetical protein
MHQPSIKELFESHTGYRVHKWSHYLEIYERYFSKFKGKKVQFLEIGVAHGGSLELWKKYFGADSNFYGIDVIPECKKFETANVKIFIGSQSSEEFLNSINNELPQVDFLLDDGGHFVNDQIVSFNLLWQKIKVGGYYICEDVQTSYWFSFGGGYKRKGTFIEFVKSLIDQMHGWHSQQPGKFSISPLTKEIKSIHIYDSIVFIEKGYLVQPIDIIKGENQVPEPVPAKKSFWIKSINKCKKIISGFR